MEINKLTKEQKKDLEMEERGFEIISRLKRALGRAREKSSDSEYNS